MPELYVDLLKSDWAHTPLNDDRLLVGDPTGEPYVVRYQDGSWLPVNVLIFAHSEADALQRVENGIKLAMALEQAEIDELIKSGGSTGLKTDVIKKGEKLLAIKDKQAEKFDKRYLAKAVWASNATLL